MTIIATDGYSISADSRCTGPSGIIQRPWTKIFPLPDGSAIGCCGSAALATILIEWITFSGETADLRPSFISEDDFEAIRLYPNGNLFSYGPHCLPEAVPFPYAIGSGSQYAIGALEAGASPQRAVEITTVYDPSCGPPVETLVVRHRKGRKRNPAPATTALRAPKEPNESSSL